jgi:hypothetical protein
MFWVYDLIPLPLYINNLFSSMPTSHYSQEKKIRKKYNSQGAPFVDFLLFSKSFTLGSPTMVTESSYWNY